MQCSVGKYGVARRYGTACWSRAQRGAARRAIAQHSMLQHGTARRATAWHSTACYSMAQYSVLQHGTAQLGSQRSAGRLSLLVALRCGCGGSRLGAGLCVRGRRGQDRHSKPSGFRRRSCCLAAPLSVAIDGSRAAFVAFYRCVRKF